MDYCKRHPRCNARDDTGHYCPASADQVRALGYRVEPRPLPTVSPFVRRALARELPAKVLR